MGLLLSVLVVCVGVLEVIACVRHFQDGYLPLWTPHCAVTSGFAITHDRWRKLPSFDYAKNDDEKYLEDLTAAKNGDVALGLQDNSVNKSVEKFEKSLHSAASLQDDQNVVSEIHLQESETIFVTQKVSDNLVSANGHEDKSNKFTSDVHKQTVTDVFQSDIYNNNLVQTQDNFEADITTVHPEESTVTSDQDITKEHEASAKKAELIQQLPELGKPEDIPDDSLKSAEKHEDNDIHETTVVGSIHHEEITHTIKDNSSESDSRLEAQTSSSDADVIQSKEIETQPQETLESEDKNEETSEELIQTLKKTPSPVRISPPSSTPPLTPKKSKADISWPTFFPGAPVIKRPSVSFATPEALLAGEDPEPHPRSDEERPATPPPIIKRSKENTPVPAELESRSVSSESLSEDVGQEEEEDNEDENLFREIREKSPSIISGNDFSKKELELQRRKSYKLKRFNSAVETVSRDEEAEERSFSEDNKGVSHAFKSREPKRRFKKPVKATSFEDAMLRDNKDADVVDGGITLKLGKVKFADEPTVLPEEEDILLEPGDQTPQEENKMEGDEGLKVSFGEVETEPEKCVIPEEEKQPEKYDFTEQTKQVSSEQKIFDEPEHIQMSHDEQLEERPNEEQISPLTKPVDENQDTAVELNQIIEERVLYKATETESSDLNIKGDENHQQVGREKIMEVKEVSQVDSKTKETKSGNEVTSKLGSKEKEDVASKQLEEDSSDIHSKPTEAKPTDELTAKFDPKQSEENLENKQASGKEEPVEVEEEEEQEEETEEEGEEEILLENVEVPSKPIEVNRIKESSNKLDPRQDGEKSQTKPATAEELEKEEIEEELVLVDCSEVHSKAMEIKPSEEHSTKTDTKLVEAKDEHHEADAEEEEEEEEVEMEEEEREVVMDDKPKVHSKVEEIKSSEERSTKTDTKPVEAKGEHDEADAEEEEEEEEVEMEEEEREVVMDDKPKVHSKVEEIKSSEERSTKTDTKPVEAKGEHDEADAEEEEEEEVEMEEEEQAMVMDDNLKVHSKVVEVRSSDEISIKTASKEDGKKDEAKQAATKEEEETERVVAVDSSKVHSKPAESKPRDENTAKLQGGKQEAASEDQQQRQSTGVRFVEPERTIKEVEGEPEDEDTSSYTYSDSTQQKTPPKEAFWLIFSGEYTKAMSKDWHSGHFCCWQCDESLTGQRYVLRDDHPYCIKCYESVFANTCEECSKIIGIDSKDLSYKDKHWHEACFLCNKCRVSLVDKQFGSKADKIYCGNCYDAQFASRCDGCGEIFRAGTKKMEYKTRQWHEKCFCCCVCKTPIGTKSFIPREQEIYCATCYEEKFATRCVKCNKIITSGGVTYKNEPWHRECFTCTHCNTSLAGQRFTSRDEKPYCADCFGELFAKRCTSCSRPITGIGGTRFISFEDRHWHNDCFICASCKTSLVGRGFITDGDDIICPECAKQKLM